MNFMLKRSTLAVALTSVFFANIALADGPFNNSDNKEDFGAMTEGLLNAQSEKLFGFEKPLKKSAPATTGAYRTLDQKATSQVLVADGLEVEYLTRSAANATDMMAFFPVNKPTHLITCVEGDRAVLATGQFNPSIQSINLVTGHVETLLRGMNSCDGIRTTPWNTILATEERNDGGAFEILGPLNISNQTVLDRTSGAVTDSAHIAKRDALPTMAWEGLAVLPTGVVFAGDELRPGTPADADGGAIFKFVPKTPRIGNDKIKNLADSPLAAGAVYAMQVSCVNDKQQYGQGCEIGNAAWLPVNASTVRADAYAKDATGYYRPEDLHQDLMYMNSANPEAVRFCWTNTGNEDAINFAEVICGVDTKPLIAAATQRTIVVNRFVEGDMDFNSFDNLEFQPKTGNLY